MFRKCASIFSLLIILSLSQNVISEPVKRLDILLEVHKEIQLLNLINGLDLDREQMEVIIQRAEAAKKIRDEFLSKIKENSQEIAQTFQTLRELRDDLMQDKNISQNLRRRVHEANVRVKQLKERYDERITELALEVKGILHEHQLYALEQYVPCLIPPEKGSRVGQAENLEGAERQLIRIRNLPYPVFERRKEEIAQVTINHIRRHLPKGYIIDEEAEKERILSIFEEARSLSDVDFALRKTELIQRLKSKYELPKPPIDISVKIERFLLTPEIIPLLKEKMETKLTER
ncbi:MAG TPA: hypothetical protein EYP60_08005 [bacterium (Candidatus Stahlbacteria)]|nr:hypothetical protein [Candidatus Stahlbacteria bacterium]